MTPQTLLSAQRTLYVLAQKPGTAQSDSNNLWYLKLEGLHQEQLKSAVAQLRKRELGHGQDRALKSTALQDSLARTLGAKSYSDWLEREQPKLIELLKQHDLKQPADLIRWTFAPGLANRLSARHFSDRIFNSGLPIPSKVLTGVGSYLFGPRGYGRLDIDQLAKQYFYDDRQRYAFCLERADTVVLRAIYMQDANCPPYIDLTGRSLMLNAVSEYIGSMYTLLGSNLTDRPFDHPVMRSYNMSEDDRAFEMKLFRLFREEIEQSDAGWIDVLTVPENENLVILKGQNGTFDWLIRDQRDSALSSNPLYPFFKKEELPIAMDTSKLTAHLYFTRGSWQEKLEHEAENSHYEKGGTVANWPGYDKLIERELIASQRVIPPRKVTGEVSQDFISHRVSEYQLMVSPLITIEQYTSFLAATGWHKTRLEKAQKASIDIERNLWSANVGDSQDLPVSVTWNDAVAYCKYIEETTGLPVRLLETEEWREIAPPPLKELVRDTEAPLGKPIDPKFLQKVALKTGPLPDEAIYEELSWGAFESGRLCEHAPPHFYKPEYTVNFGSEVRWTANSQGLPFISMLGVGEWLSGVRNLHAPAACAANHLAVAGGPIERDFIEVHQALRYKIVKVCFRLCYVAHPDA